MSLSACHELAQCPKPQRILTAAFLTSAWSLRRPCSCLLLAGLQLFIILLYFIGGLRVTGAGYFFANWAAIVLVSLGTRVCQLPILGCMFA